ncbi:MAG: 2-succinyl-5-enolpyruvyl-6-hydroxy-3-cyclohexene-1-carboxylate synthase, partial [Bacteroidetes bacterium]
MLITFGGPVVSKMVKKFLRDHPPEEHWHISPSGEETDTYFKLRKVLEAEPEVLFEELLPQVKKNDSRYTVTWKNRKELVVSRRDAYLKKTPYSDLRVFDFILKNLPEGTNLHLGNSTPVRYSQLFGSSSKFHYFSNRGVSGIDGQLSTVAGSAFVNDELHVLVTGDLGFFY